MRFRHLKQRKVYKLFLHILLSHRISALFQRSLGNQATVFIINSYLNFVVAPGSLSICLSGERIRLFRSNSPISGIFVLRTIQPVFHSKSLFLCFLDKGFRLLCRLICNLNLTVIESGCACFRLCLRRSLFYILNRISCRFFRGLCRICIILLIAGRIRAAGRISPSRRISATRGTSSS